jgi:hypothetical protein
MEQWAEIRRRVLTGEISNPNALARAGVRDADKGGEFDIDRFRMWVIRNDAVGRGTRGSWLGHQRIHRSGPTGELIALGSIAAISSQLTRR